jgi:hypothetical protein
LQHSRRKTILLHRLNGLPIIIIRERANYMNLLRPALLVDNAGHNNDASSCLSGWKFRGGSRDQSGCTGVRNMPLVFWAQAPAGVARRIRRTSQEKLVAADRERIGTLRQQPAHRVPPPCTIRKAETRRISSRIEGIRQQGGVKDSMFRIALGRYSVCVRTYFTSGSPGSLTKGREPMRLSSQVGFHADSIQPVSRKSKS